MLHKIRAVRQDEASRERHWFQDDFFDLFVWTDESGTIVAFQLCYDRLNHERVLAWNATSGFSHRGVDDGENTPLKNMSPIMVADGRFAAERIAAEFGRRAKKLDSRLHDFIYGKIGEAGIVISRSAG
jgi:hypothetical protein